MLLLLLPACSAVVVTRPGVSASVVATTGQSVILYAGEAKDSSRQFCPGDVLVVYRGPDKARASGRVRITTYAGEHHLRGVVIEGGVRKGDVVRKGSVACTVQSAPASSIENEGTEMPKPK